MAGAAGDSAADGQHAECQAQSAETKQEVFEVPPLCQPAASAARSGTGELEALRSAALAGGRLLKGELGSIPVVQLALQSTG